MIWKFLGLTSITEICLARRAVANTAMFYITAQMGTSKQVSTFMEGVDKHRRAIMKENFYVFYIYTTKYFNFLTLLWNRELGSRQLMNLLIALLVNMAS